jgi:hypothetical protein
MKTDYACLRCGQAFATDRDLSGRRVRCRVCGLVQRVPDLSTPSQPAPLGYALAPSPMTASASMPADPSSFVPALQPLVKRSQARWLDRLRPWVFETSQVQGIGSCLVLLSAADLFMTFLLLRRSPAFFESNPIACWFFDRWNMAGMVFFKFSLIGGVILLSEIIERNRPGWGRFVLFVGCLGAAYAVFHGGRLYMADSVPVSAEYSAEVY